MKTWAPGEDVFAADINSNFNDAAFKVFGDGSDGDVIISVNTSLARDMYYKNLTINNGIILNPNGYRVFVKGILKYVGTGKIARDGNAGTTGSVSNTDTPANNRGAGGLGLANGTLFGSLPGGYGGSGYFSGGYSGRPETGQVGGAANPSIPNVGGVAGGLGGKSGAGGGIGGVATLESFLMSGLRKYSLATQTLNAENEGIIFDVIKLTGVTSAELLSGCAASGGGGGGGGTGGWYTGYGGSGGGGGSNGGVIYIAAFKIITVNENTFVQAKGGVGAAGQSVGDGGGGGGGGGGGQGGLVVLVYRELVGTGVIDVSGGLGGALGTGPGGNGVAGTNGNAGKYIKVKIV